MKGSTLKRSGLSRENIEMLRALPNYISSYNRQSGNAIENKQETLDMLWQTFKVAQKVDKSPIAFFTTGVFVGVILTLIMAIIISFAIGYSPLDEININMPKAVSTPKDINTNFTFIPADTKQEPATLTENSSNKEYIVQSGDSLERIAIQFYGGYDVSKINTIKEANNLSNADAITIGQKLIIPLP